MSTRDEYVNSLKQSFITIGKDAVMRLLIQKIPFFSLPFFNPLAAMAVGWVVKQLAVGAETGAFFLYIDMRVSAQAKDFELAAYANRQAQLTGTPEEKARAAKVLKIAFAKFVRLTS